MKKFISALLALLTCLLCLASCQKKQPDEPQDTDEGTTGTEITEFSKDLITQFKIVYPNGGAQTVYAAAENLASMIGKYLGTVPAITTDLINEGSSHYTEYEYEILIGSTNREESKQFLNGLRRESYGYSCIGKKIVIGAQYDELLVKAVEAFTSDIISGKRREDFLFRKEWSKTFEGEYKFESFTVNGEDVLNYQIVYSTESGSFGSILATKLKNAICERTGYVLPVGADVNMPKGKHELLIGTTNRKTELPIPEQEERKGYITASGGLVYMGGSTAYGNAVAVQAFIEKIVADDEKKCDLKISDIEAHTKDEALLSAMTWNVLTGGPDNARANRVIGSIAKYLPDTFGIQEGNDVWMSKLPAALGDYYAYVGKSSGAGPSGTEKNSYNTIFYAREKFNLIESGTKWPTDTPDEESWLPGQQFPRTFVYALLEDKTTGQRYLHLNTHLDVSMAGDDLSEVRYREVLIILNFLKRFDDVPVILSGDMNCQLSSTELQTFLLNAFEYPADVLGVDIKTTFEFSGDSVIDFIFATTDSIEPVTYLADPCIVDGYWSSDHYAVYFTFRLKDVEDLSHGWNEIHEPESPVVEGQLTVKPTPEDDPDMGPLHRW